MIKILINSIRYSTIKTKAIMIATVVCLMISIGFIAMAVAAKNMIFVFAAIVSFFATIFMAQTFAINGMDDIKNHGDEEYDEDEAGLPASFDGNPIILDKHNSELTAKKRGKKVNASRSDDKGNNQISTDEVKLHEKKRRKKKKERKKQYEQDSQQNKNTEISEKKDDINSQSETKLVDEITAELMDDNITEKEQLNGRIEPASKQDIRTYDKKKIRRVMHTYKVRRDHRRVFVDHSDKMNINQTPAYIWKDTDYFHILLIEKEPRHLTFGIRGLDKISYLKKYHGDPTEEYQIYFNTNNLMTNLFKPYLPEYNTSNDSGQFYKNLYGIKPDIWFTNKSAENLFDVLNVEFDVQDKVTQSNKVNSYFKYTYKANIKLRDGVIDANKYADEISDILGNMTSSSMSYNEFKETLNLMVRNKLITQEFAMYYMDLRDKKH